MRLITFILFIFFSNATYAQDFERVELANYLRELNKIDRIYQNAKIHSDTKKLYRFKYKNFEKDLAKIKEGIKDYLEAPKREPKILTNKNEPVGGKY
ncbi:RAQPRD family integrative conjugative element protein [Aliikangiella maris]|uniref:RAQPRD family integrative conjugative element protein n=2 Tax=Aliikangiella maris TaxID=3162458 RepID=A0ABV2BYE2_9GAMM